MTGVVHTGGLPLEEFNPKTPPGWQPGMDSWPFKKYLEKLKMWYRTSEYKVGDGIIGPLVALRLKGEAYEIAVKLA